jgi:hypothetical protein
MGVDVGVVLLLMMMLLLLLGFMMVRLSLSSLVDSIYMHHVFANRPHLADLGGRSFARHFSTFSGF